MCSGRSAERAGLAVAVVGFVLCLANCSMQVPGTAVVVAFESEVLPDRIADASVDFRRGFVVVEEVELVPCDPTLTARAWRALSLPVAHAHGESSPTQLGVSVAVDLTQATRIEAGLLAPPAGRYCSVRLRAAPSDGDGIGVVSEMGQSMVVEGTAIDQEHGAMTLEWRSSSVVDRVVDLVEPLVLDASQKEHSLVVTISPEDWLQPKDLLERSPSGGAQLLRRLVQDAQVRHRSLSP